VQHVKLYNLKTKLCRRP